MNKLNEAEMEYYFMSTLNEWFNHSKKSDEDIIFALKHVSLADNCTICEKSGEFIEPMRFPIAVDYQSESWGSVVAQYECHVCFSEWVCAYSKDFINIFSFE